jgi:hypothetical protein
MRCTSPQILLPVGLFAALLSSVGGSGCDNGGQSDAAPSYQDGSLLGELGAYTSDDFEGGSETRFVLRDRQGRERPLIFNDAPDIAPGTNVRVWGAETPEGFRVLRVLALEPEIVSVTSALRNAAPFPARAFAFVLVDLGGGVNTTADAAMGRLITAADSIRNYYLTDSFGTQDVTAQVFGPITYTINGCGTSQLATDLRPMIQGTFQHYLWYLGSRQTACGWTGLASLGTPDKPSRDTWYNASTSCVVLVQEPGHNFGMQHSSSLACPGAPLADDPNTCVASEYGDPFDPMGGGCRHMNAWQKDYQGWFGGCNGVTVSSSGTFTLLPLEQRCDGVQFLKIPAPKTRMFMRPAGGGGSASTETFSHYYVELRTGQDFDGILGNRTALAPQVLIHIGGDRRARTQRGLHTFLLDMTPTTTGTAGRADSALGVGKTFSDPAGGLSITVQAVSAAQATIRVDIPGGTLGPTCLDDSAFTAPGPGQEACSAPVPTGVGGAPGGTGAAGAGGAPGGTGAAGSGVGGTSGAAGAVGSTGAAGMGGPGAAGTGGTVTGAAGTGVIGTGAAGTSGTGAGGSSEGVAGAPGTGAATGAGGSGTLPRQGGGEVVGSGCNCGLGTGSMSTGGGFTTAGAFVLGLSLLSGRRSPTRRRQRAGRR